MCGGQVANTPSAVGSRCRPGFSESERSNEDKALDRGMITQGEAEPRKTDTENPDVSEEMKLAFGRNCKAARAQTGMSQGQLAALTRFPQSMVSNIEAGRVNLTIQTMVTIAKALQVELTQLVGTSTQK